MSCFLKLIQKVVVGETDFLSSRLVDEKLNQNKQPQNLQNTQPKKKNRKSGTPNKIREKVGEEVSRALSSLLSSCKVEAFPSGALISLTPRNISQTISRRGVEERSREGGEEKGWKT